MNPLAGQTSPYLLQHVDNPVHWYPWGDEALALAREQNKPILLSIGYSACHWCHVMAHESFEDTASAEVMNRLFINIKVDREERPDLDKIYQTAHTMLTQRNGGWPLTMFLTPDDQIPFFGGTYFPREPRHGLPAFTDLIQRIADFYHNNTDDVRTQNASLMDAMQSITRTSSADTLDPMPLDVARQQLAQTFDDTHGGFGGAPKFPHPGTLERLLCQWTATSRSDSPDQHARHMVTHSLRKMALGGVFDQLGGGFYRYSVDERWMIPHFEKMLYDNAQLLALYSQAWAITGDALFSDTVAATAAWALREMQAPEGGYYSSLDADSEGEEGRFYVWQPDEVRAILTDKEYEIFAAVYGLDRKPNFEGRWHLHVYQEAEKLAGRSERPIETLREQLDSAHARLLPVRERRIRPGRDDKILTSWNGLMIRGMAVAARTFNRPDWAQSATRALDYIRDHLWVGHRLLATGKDGKVHLNAYLDDHVFLIDGILELLQVRWNKQDLAFAIELTELLLKHFQDPAGGFFFTADDHEQLIQRPKPLSDDATPSGNGIAAQVLIKLGHLLGETRYLQAAEATLKCAWPSLEPAPHLHPSLLQALEAWLFPHATVIIRDTGDADEWCSRVQKHARAGTFTLAIPAAVTGLPGLLETRSGSEQTVTYICQGERCLPPVTELDQLKDQLRA